MSPIKIWNGNLLIDQFSSVQKINNNNNNRFIISTIGPTWHSLLVTKVFLRLLSASYALCSIIFAYLELQRLHIACHNFSQHDFFHAFLSPYHECLFLKGTTKNIEEKLRTKWGYWKIHFVSGISTLCAVSGSPVLVLMRRVTCGDCIITCQLRSLTWAAEGAMTPGQYWYVWNI